MDQEPKNIITENLAPMGRLLLVMTALLGGGTLYVLIDGGVASLPSGRYPLYLFVLTVLVGGFIFYWSVAKILEKFGFLIYKAKTGADSTKHDDESND